MTHRTMALLLAGLLLAACRDELVPSGAWGDEHVSLTVNDDGGRVEFDCAHGTLDHPLRLDDRGRFSVPGTFVPEGSAPAGASDTTVRKRVRYQGRLDRQKIEFTVTVEGQAARGPYSVTLAKAAKLEKCR